MKKIVNIKVTEAAAHSCNPKIQLKEPDMLELEDEDFDVNGSNTITVSHLPLIENENKTITKSSLDTLDAFPREGNPKNSVINLIQGSGKEVQNKNSVASPNIKEKYNKANCGNYRASVHTIKTHNVKNKTKSESSHPSVKTDFVKETNFDSKSIGRKSLRIRDKNDKTTLTGTGSEFINNSNKIEECALAQSVNRNLRSNKNGHHFLTQNDSSRTTNESDRSKNHPTLKLHGKKSRDNFKKGNEETSRNSQSLLKIRKRQRENIRKQGTSSVERKESEQKIKTSYKVLRSGTKVSAEKHVNSSEISVEVIDQVEENYIDNCKINRRSLRSHSKHSNALCIGIENKSESKPDDSVERISDDSEPLTKRLRCDEKSFQPSNQKNNIRIVNVNTSGSPASNLRWRKSQDIKKRQEVNSGDVLHKSSQNKMNKILKNVSVVRNQPSDHCPKNDPSSLNGCNYELRNKINREIKVSSRYECSFPSSISNRKQEHTDRILNPSNSCPRKSRYDLRNKHNELEKEFLNDSEFNNESSSHLLSQGSQNQAKNIQDDYSSKLRLSSQNYRNNRAKQSKEQIKATLADHSARGNNAHEPTQNIMKQNQLFNYEPADDKSHSQLHSSNVTNCDKNEVNSSKLLQLDESVKKLKNSDISEIRHSQNILSGGNHTSSPNLLVRRLRNNKIIEHNSHPGNKVHCNPTNEYELSKQAYDRSKNSENRSQPKELPSKSEINLKNISKHHGAEKDRYSSDNVSKKIITSIQESDERTNMNHIEPSEGRKELNSSLSLSQMLENKNIDRLDESTSQSASVARTDSNSNCNMSVKSIPPASEKTTCSSSDEDEFEIIEYDTSSSSSSSFEADISDDNLKESSSEPNINTNKDINHSSGINEQRPIYGKNNEEEEGNSQKTGHIIQLKTSSGFIVTLIDSERPAQFRDEKARRMWDHATSVNAARMVAQIESGQFVSEKVQKQIDEQRKARELRRADIEKKIKWIQVEAAVLEADMNIKLCLNESACPHKVDRCLRYLETLYDLDIEPLMLKKFSFIVETIASLQNYVGSEKGVRIHEIEKFKEKAKKIRSKAEDIYKKFMDLFPVPENEDFSDIFADIVEAFEQQTQDVNPYSLTEDPQATEE